MNRGVLGRWDFRGRGIEKSFAPLLDGSRARAVLDLAQRSPDRAANIEEMSIVKRGAFAGVDRGAADIARLVVWNIERGRSPEKWAAIDAIREADILLLCEVDDGMARSNNLDITADLADRLGMHYAFAPNYFELTRGTRSERIATRGQRNFRGLHGNAILSRWPLRDVRRLPLPVEFDWFQHEERRIGTRVALRATIDGPRESLTVAVAHLEALAAPVQRARQMRVLVESFADAPRVILGGDFNTLGIYPSWRPALRLLGACARDAHRLTHTVVALEPLFDEAESAGFFWKGLNAPSPTWRLNRFVPRYFQARLDWIFGRNVLAEPGSSAVIAAPIDGSFAGSPRLSDHDGLALRLRL